MLASHDSSINSLATAINSKLGRSVTSITSSILPNSTVVAENYSYGFKMDKLVFVCIDVAFKSDYPQSGWSSNEVLYGLPPATDTVRIGCLAQGSSTACLFQIEGLGTTISTYPAGGTPSTGVGYRGTMIYLTTS